MVNILTLIPVVVSLVQGAVALAQIETSNHTTEQKEAEFMALAPKLVPLVDQLAGLPAGAVEKYLTPATLNFAYDVVHFAKAKVDNPAA